MIFFTADLHLDHANIIKFCNRPFNDVEHMNKVLIDNINDAVESEDSLYILGDFCLGNSQKWRAFRNRIVCRDIILIRGNHDKQFPNSLFSRADNLITKVFDISWGGIPITLCHYAMRTWPASHFGSWHLYGHSHNSLYEDPTSLCFDVGVDGNDFKPYSLEDVENRMKPKVIERNKIKNAAYYIG